MAETPSELYSALKGLRFLSFIAGCGLRCGRCARQLGPGDRGMHPCTGCLVVQYCSKTCQDEDRGGHGTDCAKMAIAVFIAKWLSTPGASLRDSPYVGEVMQHVYEHGTLPEGLTLSQVDEWVAHARVALAHRPILQVQANCFTVLAVCGLCADKVKRDPQDQEAFVAAADEMLGRIPLDSRLWSYSDVVGSCMAYGNVLFKMGRVGQAVAFGRRVKPLIEASVWREVKPERRDFSKYTFIDFLEQICVRDGYSPHPTVTAVSMVQAFAMWLSECEDDGSGKYKGAYEAWRKQRLDESLGLLQQAIELTESIPSWPAGPSTLAQLYYLKAEMVHATGAYDQALEIARRGMQIPTRRHGLLMSQAITCLVELRRDAQAEPMIKEVLAQFAEDPKALNDLEHASVLHKYGTILCRRGDYATAYSMLQQAADLWEEVARRRGKQTGKAAGMMCTEATVQLLEAMERTGRVKQVEALEAKDRMWKSVRPLRAVQEAHHQLERGRKAEAMGVLREYARGYKGKELVWRLRDRWKEGDAVKPLELLRDLLEEGSGESKRVQALITQTAREDEALRREALEELQKEMREERARRDEEKQQADAGSRTSKASRKKKKKRERKKQQRSAAQSVAEEESVMEGTSLAKLSLEDEGEEPAVSGETGADEAVLEQQQEEEADECPMCLLPFGEDKDEAEEGGEEALGCGHRFHDVCIDRWLCKCREKGLSATCPMCRSELVRGAGTRG